MNRGPEHEQEQRRQDRQRQRHLRPFEKDLLQVSLPALGVQLRGHRRDHRGDGDEEVHQVDDEAVGDREVME